MVLCDNAIRECMRWGDIQITPYDDTKLGTNSYDLHLSPHLIVIAGALDMRKPTQGEAIEIDAQKGYELQPGVLYLGATIEHTVTKKHLPIINGKSSNGRLGLSIHKTAGWGDVGFTGHWTLEFSVVVPLRIYAGAPIAQIMYYDATEPQVPYDQKPSANYSAQGALPAPSKMYINFDKKLLKL